MYMLKKKLFLLYETLVVPTIIANFSLMIYRLIGITHGLSIDRKNVLILSLQPRVIKCKRYPYLSINMLLFMIYSSTVHPIVTSI